MLGVLILGLGSGATCTQSESVVTTETSADPLAPRAGTDEFLAYVPTEFESLGWVDLAALRDVPEAEGASGVIRNYLAHRRPDLRRFLETEGLHPLDYGQRALLAAPGFRWNWVVTVEYPMGPVPLEDSFDGPARPIGNLMAGEISGWTPAVRASATTPTQVLLGTPEAFELASTFTPRALAFWGPGDLLAGYIRDVGDAFVSAEPGLDLELTVRVTLLGGPVGQRRFRVQMDGTYASEEAAIVGEAYLNGQLSEARAHPMLEVSRLTSLVSQVQIQRSGASVSSVVDANAEEAQIVITLFLGALVPPPGMP